MPTIQQVTEHLEGIAPLCLQEDYDNAGLIVGNPNEEIRGVLCCLDSTEEVLEEAIRLGCNLVIAHHPIVFKGLKRINGASYVERCVIKAIRHGIAIYAAHTNLDSIHRLGVNQKIAETIGLIETNILQPKPAKATANSTIERVGSGLIGLLPEAMDAFDFLATVKQKMEARCIRHTSLIGRPIKKVAVCGGSGSFLIPAARSSGADAFITADVKYHEFFDAENQVLLMDIGHFESEQFTIQLLFEIISKKFSNFALHCTKVNTNPLHYF